MGWGGVGLGRVVEGGSAVRAGVVGLGRSQVGWGVGLGKNVATSTRDYWTEGRGSP